MAALFAAAAFASQALALGRSATVACGSTPWAVAVSLPLNKIYVANSGDGTLSVIDGATYQVTTVNVGSTPKAVAVNSATGAVVVANSGSSNLSIVDPFSLKVSTVPTGANPVAIAIDSARNQIYVANSGSGTITVVDGASYAPTTITVGGAPTAVAVNAATNKLYVTNAASGIAVIDGMTRAVTPMAGGSNPAAIAIDAVANRIYVANSGGGTVTVIDGATNVTSTVSLGTGPGINPVSIAVNPLTHKVYVACSGSGIVSVIDGPTLAVSSIVVGATPSALALNLHTNQIYVTTTDAGFLTAIDGASNNVMPVAVGTKPVAVAVNPLTNKIYAANSGSGTMSVVDGALNKVATIPTGEQPYVSATNPNTNKIYVANTFGNSVTVINGATNMTSTVGIGRNSQNLIADPATATVYAIDQSANLTIIDGATDHATILPLGRTNPAGLALNPVTGRIYVSHAQSMTVTVIDAATKTIIATISTDGYPVSLAVNPITNKIYVTNNTYVNDVQVIDGGTNTITASIPVGEQPGNMVVNPVTNKIYVSCWSDVNVWVIDGVTNQTSKVLVGGGIRAIHVNPITNKIYMANSGGGAAVIDGTTNTAAALSAGGAVGAISLNVKQNKVYFGINPVQSGNNQCAIVDGATNAILGTVGVGPAPIAISFNPATNTVYVSNFGHVPDHGTTVTAVSEMPLAVVPLATAITAISGNRASGLSPTFQIITQGSPGPSMPAAQSVYVQIDTVLGAWRKATGSGGAFVASPGALLPGYHTLYAYADDGQAVSQASAPLLSPIVQYTFLAAPVPTGKAGPTITGQPQGQTINAGATVTLSVGATGDNLSYQWQFNGAGIPGATGQMLTLPNVSLKQAGAYTVVVSDGTQTTTSAPATVSVTSSARLVNISALGTLTPSLADAGVLIAGFVITGAASKSVLVRGVGPLLADFGVSPFLARPGFTFYNAAGTSLASAAKWDASLAAVFSRVGAAPFHADSNDSALLQTLSAGGYSAVVSSDDGTTGAALAEIYDADAGVPTNRIINLSARAYVTASNVLIGGFVVGGSTAETVLIRAIGPGLIPPSSGVVRPPPFTILSRPNLSLYDAAGNLITSNAGWGNPPAAPTGVWAGKIVPGSVTAPDFVSVGAFGLQPGSADSAFIVTLQPGAYTAHVRSGDSGAGIALLEVYEMR